MTINFRSNLVFNFEKKTTISLEVLMFFTGKSENLPETPILKDIFIFVENGHCFEKC